MHRVGIGREKLTLAPSKFKDLGNPSMAPTEFMKIFTEGWVLFWYVLDDNTVGPSGISLRGRKSGSLLTVDLEITLVSLSNDHDCGDR